MKSKRRCLRCERIFKSEWAGNRICTICKVTIQKSYVGKYDQEDHHLTRVRKVHAV